MAENSGIEWTTHTFNPWWGCVKVSPACTNCYAATLAGRFGTEWGPKARRRFFGTGHWNEPRKWNAKAEREGGERPRVFCASMADVFEELPSNHPDAGAMVGARARLLNLIYNTPSLDWLLLTKRPENVERLWDEAATEWGEPGTLGFPMPNVWIGTTVENQEQADKRIPELLKIPAAVRFLSCEPLLGPVDLRRIPTVESEEFLSPLWGKRWRAGSFPDQIGFCPEIHWVIAGGESGPGARPSHPDWFRTLRDQCEAAGVPFHFKQWGEYAPLGEGVGPEFAAKCHEGNRHYWSDLGRGSYRVGKKAAGRVLDGRTWDQFPEAAGC